jgi:hypothetical protein
MHRERWKLCRKVRICYFVKLCFNKKNWKLWSVYIWSTLVCVCVCVYIYVCVCVCVSVQVAAQSKAYVCGRSPAEIVGSNPTGGIDVCRLWALSGRGLCDELITRPEESYWLLCVVVCDLETSWMRRFWPTGGCCARNKQTVKLHKKRGNGPIATILSSIILHITQWHVSTLTKVIIRHIPRHRELSFTLILWKGKWKVAFHYSRGLSSPF